MQSKKTIRTEIELEQLGRRELKRARRRERRARCHRANRAAHRKRHPGRAAWRKAPATEAQLEALRQIATRMGRTFKDDITRGEAWRRIREATLVNPRLHLSCAPPWYTTPGTKPTPR